MTLQTSPGGTWRRHPHNAATPKKETADTPKGLDRNRSARAAPKPPKKHYERKQYDSKPYDRDHGNNAGSRPNYDRGVRNNGGGGRAYDRDRDRCGGGGGYYRGRGGGRH